MTAAATSTAAAPHSLADFRLELALLARGDDNAEKIVRMLRENGLRDMARAAGSWNHARSALLAVFGIHPCSGCGFDPERYTDEHGKECNGCGGRGWYHEEVADPGVSYRDPQFGFDFTVRNKPGMFGRNREVGWTPKWEARLTR